MFELVLAAMVKFAHALLSYGKLLLVKIETWV